MTNFTLRQLEIFSLAAQYGSFSFVAKTLHMSKPAITKQIQALEAHLNIKLFHKHGRGIRLTPESQRLLPQVKSILEETSKMKKMIELGLDQSKPILKFSTTNTYSGLLFNAMKNFITLNEVEYEVFVEPQDRGYKKIEQDKIDFLVTDVEINDPNLVLIPFCNMRFVLVGSKSNILLSATKVTINSFEDIPFIQIKPKTQPKRIHPKQNLVQEHFKKIIQLESYYSIKEAIKSNLGIGILPENLLVDDMGNLQILPVKQLQFEKKIYLVTNQKLQQTQEQFINYIQTDFKISEL